MADEKMVFDNFENVVAIFDVDKDGDLDCLTAVRTDYDKDASIVTYLWILKSVNGHQWRNISFEARPGPMPSQFLIRNKDADEPYKLGTYDYTDYKNCVVMEMPYNHSDGDAPLQVGKYLYSDYKDCLLLEMPYENSQECMLWISWEVKNNIPKACTDHYEDSCDDSKLAFDEATCKPFFEQNK
ncbi:hypothetical protein HPB50_019332 [Hyalomma asiaticum]|uniref:Uncharacterized protein n=1 Tax=Hyalomma asiaticum TaxID=266040 RepID=A0ACB7T0M0_HYAAI|nr:hypothetical protein HPB50_019332 [Hyalomma asiaticum]